jgi:hypothetical protein
MASLAGKTAKPISLLLGKKANVTKRFKQMKIH